MHALYMYFVYVWFAIAGYQVKCQCVVMHQHPETKRTKHPRCCATGMLRNLSSYYGKDAQGLHLVRVAQGLLHMGKGLTTINPYHSDRNLLSPLALASLLTLLHCGTNPSATLCGKPAYMMYYIVPAVRPRMLLTVDEAGDVVPVSVRVGTAVDTVAQAGQPKSITGAVLDLILLLLILLHLHWGVLLPAGTLETLLSFGICCRLPNTRHTSAAGDE